MSGLTEQDMREIIKVEGLAHVKLEIRDRRGEEMEGDAMFTAAFASSFDSVPATPKRIIKAILGRPEHFITFFTETLVREPHNVPVMLLHEIAHVKTFPLSKTELEDDKGHTWKWFRIFLDLCKKYNLSRNDMVPVDKWRLDRYSRERWEDVKDFVPVKPSPTATLPISLDALKNLKWVKFDESDRVSKEA